MIVLLFKKQSLGFFFAAATFYDAAATPCFFKEGGGVKLGLATPSYFLLKNVYQMPVMRCVSIHHFPSGSIGSTWLDPLIDPSFTLKFLRLKFAQRPSFRDLPTNYLWFYFRGQEEKKDARNLKRCLLPLCNLSRNLRPISTSIRWVVMPVTTRPTSELDWIQKV